MCLQNKEIHGGTADLALWQSKFSSCLIDMTQHFNTTDETESKEYKKRHYCKNMP